jgi:hypothetical protein
MVGIARALIARLCWFYTIFMTVIRPWEREHLLLPV